MGRCDTAPTLELGHNHIDYATLEKVEKAISENDTHFHMVDYESLADYEKGGGYAELTSLIRNGDWKEVQEKIYIRGWRKEEERG